MTNYTIEAAAQELKTSMVDILSALDKSGGITEDQIKMISAIISDARRNAMDEQIYMNVMTGATGPYDDWWYEGEDGLQVNAVARNEVVEVIKVENDETGETGWAIA